MASVASNKGDNSAAVVFEGDSLAVFETFLRTIPTCSADAQTYLRDALGCSILLHIKTFLGLNVVDAMVCSDH